MNIMALIVRDSSQAPEVAMFRTADMLEIFQQYRGDAIVVPGRGGRHWV